MPHQPQLTGVSRRRRGIALAVSLGVLALATACGGDEGKASVNTKPTSAASAPAAGVVAPAKVEVIAGLIGCTASIRIDADELREGVCKKGKDGYRITTFPEEKYKETWLESASVYGGKYLVGMRWVVSAKPELLEPLRPRIGGTVRELRGIGPSAAPSLS
ncbi:hypothetical protein [Streptomyces lincolnensis]|uniref:hypothetical protein n=1 Tax=Streptomyces lincolnensis TaxID=1915 RepID=UPI0037D21C3C